MGFLQKKKLLLAVAVVICFLAVGLVVCFLKPAVQPVAVSAEYGFVKVNGAEIFYRTAGQGEVLVFVHGLGVNSDMWEEQIQFFAPFYKVVAIDLRGHGRSKIDDGAQVQFEDWADDIVAVLKQLEIEKAHMCGLSLGGRIVFDLYSRYPAVVMSIIAADTVVNFPADRIKAVVDRRVENLDKVGLAMVANNIAKGGLSSSTAPEKVAAVAAMIAGNNQQRYRDNIIAAAGGKDVDLKNIKVPVLIICGQNDFTTPVTFSQYLHNSIPNSKLKVISQASHLSNIDQPETFNKELRSFLKGIK
jgi:pimeloyl-ACP methyl ester carboxylesterase